MKETEDGLPSLDAAPAREQPDLPGGSAARCRETEPARLPPTGSLLRHLNCPVLLMNVPLSLSALVPNNAWMEAMSAIEREFDRDPGNRQFLCLYRHISQDRDRVPAAQSVPGPPGSEALRCQPWRGVAAPQAGHRNSLAVPVGAPRRRGKYWRRVPQADGLSRRATSRGAGRRAGLLRGRERISSTCGATSMSAPTGCGPRAMSCGGPPRRFEMDIVPFRITDPLLYRLELLHVPHHRRDGAALHRSRRSHLPAEARAALRDRRHLARASLGRDDERALARGRAALRLGRWGTGPEK